MKKTNKLLLCGVVGLVLFLIIVPNLSLPGIRQVMKASARPIGDNFPTYTGTVKDDFGKPIAGAYVRLFSNGLQVSTDYTDSSGYYCVGNDIVSSAQLEVSKSGYYTKTIAVSSRGGTYNFVLASKTFFYSNFETDSLGGNPSNWQVTEYHDISDVRVVDLAAEGLANGNSRRALKMTQNEYGAAPTVLHFTEALSLTTPVLFSFQVAFDTLYDDGSNYAYAKVWTSSGFQLLSLMFTSNSIGLSDDGSAIHPILDPDFQEKEWYQFDILFEQNDGGSSLTYSLYLNKEILVYETISKNVQLKAIEFMVNAHSETSFYVDNVMFGKTIVGATVYNYQAISAESLCRLYAPGVQGVENVYHVGRTRSVKVTIALSAGLSFKFVGVSVSFPIYDMYLYKNDEYYGVSRRYGENDAVVFIKTTYLLDKKAIRLPGETDTYLESISNIRFKEAKFADLSVQDFKNQYDYLPITEGYKKIGTHTKTYSIHEGAIMEYKQEASSERSVTLSVKLGKFVAIKASLTFSEKVYAQNYLLVDRSIQPKFEYGKPQTHYAYLGIQPYIVKPYSAPNPTPKPPPIKPIILKSFGQVRNVPQEHLSSIRTKTIPQVPSAVVKANSRFYISVIQRRN